MEKIQKKQPFGTITERVQKADGRIEELSFEVHNETLFNIYKRKADVYPERFTSVILSEKAKVKPKEEKPNG